MVELRGRSKDTLKTAGPDMKKSGVSSAGSSGSGSSKKKGTSKSGRRKDNKDLSSERSGDGENSGSSRRGSHNRRSKGSEGDSPDSPPSGSSRSSRIKREDSLENLLNKVKMLDPNPKITISDVSDVSGTGSSHRHRGSGGGDEGDPSMTAICNLFSEPAKKTTKKSHKDGGDEGEGQGEPDTVDLMIRQSQQVVAAVGRRQFDTEEIVEEGIGDTTDEEGNEDELQKERLKKIKPRYLKMFEKKIAKTAASSAESESAADLEAEKNPQTYGLWDTVSDTKILPTLAKAKKEWQPPDWEKTMEKLKEEGRDAASIDQELKTLGHSSDMMMKTRTGKYLMPEDLAWCRKFTKFREKDLLKWFRRFRKEIADSKGEMSAEEFKRLFSVAFPQGDAEIFRQQAWSVLTPNGEEFDFKVSGVEKYCYIFSGCVCISK